MVALRRASGLARTAVVGVMTGTNRRLPLTRVAWPGRRRPRVGPPTIPCEEAPVTTQQLPDLQGKTVFDSTGQQIGNVQRVYFDKASNEPI